MALSCSAHKLRCTQRLSVGEEGTRQLWVQMWNCQASISTCTECAKRARAARDGSTHIDNGHVRGLVADWPGVFPAFCRPVSAAWNPARPGSARLYDPALQQTATQHTAAGELLAVGCGHPQHITPRHCSCQGPSSASAAARSCSASSACTPAWAARWRKAVRTTSLWSKARRGRRGMGNHCAACKRYAMEGRAQ